MSLAVTPTNSSTLSRQPLQPSAPAPRFRGSVSDAKDDAIVGFFKAGAAAGGVYVALNVAVTVLTGDPGAIHLLEGFESLRQAYSSIFPVFLPAFSLLSAAAEGARTLVEGRSGS